MKADVDLVFDSPSQLTVANTSIGPRSVRQIRPTTEVNVAPDGNARDVDSSGDVSPLITAGFPPWDPGAVDDAVHSVTALSSDVFVPLYRMALRATRSAHVRVFV